MLTLSMPNNLTPANLYNAQLLQHNGNVGLKKHPLRFISRPTEHH